MKNKIKKILSFAAVFTVAMSAFQLQPKAQEVESYTVNQQLITRYVSSLGSENNSWLDYYAPSLRGDYKNFIDSGSNDGLLSIDQSKPFFITKIDNVYSPKFNELADFYEDGSYETYLVGETLRVNHECNRGTDIESTGSSILEQIKIERF